MWVGKRRSLAPWKAWATNWWTSSGLRGGCCASPSIVCLGASTAHAAGNYLQTPMLMEVQLQTWVQVLMLVQMQVLTQVLTQERSATEARL